MTGNATTTHNLDHIDTRGSKTPSMARGGGGGVPVSPLAEKAAAKKRRSKRRRHKAQAAAACLPLDAIVEIAARSDAATLVSCAATCRDARRRIAGDPSLLGRLRLRDTERFVLPLLRGHMTGIKAYTSDFKETTDVFMVDTTTAADATGLVKATFAEADETLLMDSRGGLVLVRATTTTMAQNNTHRPLLVGDLATRRCQALPPEPAFPDDVRSTGGPGGESVVQYVLLVGGSSDGEGASAGADAAVGRPFQVLKVTLVLSPYLSYRRLLLHTFSSEHGAWSPLTDIPTPNLRGSGQRLSRPLVVGDFVHWLCLTDSESYMLMLHVGTAQVNVTSLPASFPRDGKNNHPYDVRHQYLLATETAGGNPIVLVADADRISAWEQSKHTKMWKPQVVIENETILGFKDDGLAKLIAKEKERSWGKTKHVPLLLWFGERSGAVFLRIQGRSPNHGGCLLWLDLHSKKIVRCFSDRRMQCAQVYCPYEVDISSWVPTFSSVVTL